MGTVLIIAIVALVVAIMALPTVFQMFGGAPNIEVMRGTHGTTLLFFSLRNKPVTNRFLKTMRVYRMKPVYPFFIFNIIAVENNAIKVQVRKENLQISKLWTDFNLVNVDNEHVVISEKNNLTLLPGEYYFELSVGAENYAKKYNARFMVSKPPNNIYWLSAICKIAKNNHG